jgi:hypothetical protein
MLIKGFAVYPGLDNAAEENLELIEKAAALGYRNNVCFSAYSGN